MQRMPLLFLGDNPALQTGLGRIGRDLALLASGMPQWRVGYLGRGGIASRSLPFMQYSFDEARQWGETYLQGVWEDFAGDEPGVVFTVWDPSRVFWFARPSCGEFLLNAPFKRWGYFAVDSYGPGGRLSAMSRDAVAAYDRVCAYGAWGAQVLEKSIRRPVEWMPHGINFDVFRPRDRTASRVALGFDKKDLVVGCVMSNQARKDWGLFFSVCALLRQKHRRLRIWCHTDAVERYWNLLALSADFGLEPLITTRMSDEELSYGYSACDLTMLPSLGEGFGYPIVESLACGVPVLHGNFGGGSELVPSKSLLVEPQAFRLDTIHDCVRPVFDPAAWVVGAETALDLRMDFRSSVEHLAWRNLAKPWRRWFAANDLG